MTEAQSSKAAAAAAAAASAYIASLLTEYLCHILMGHQAAGEMHGASGAPSAMPTMQAAAPQNGNAMMFKMTNDATKHIDSKVMDIVANTGRNKPPTSINTDSRGHKADNRSHHFENYAEGINHTLTEMATQQSSVAQGM